MISGSDPWVRHVRLSILVSGVYNSVMASARDSISRLAGIAGLSALMLLVVLQAAPAATGPSVATTRIADNVYEISCTDGATSNCLALTGENGVLLVDTGLEQTAGLLSAAVDSLGAGPVRYVLNTHAHFDHNGANALFGPQATIVAHDGFTAAYRTGYGLLTELPDAAFPDTTFLKKFSLEFGGETIEMTHFRSCHSAADAIVSLERAGIVCLGDLVASDRFPYLDLAAGGDIHEYAKTLYKLRIMFGEGTVFVPGHGRNITRDDLGDYLSMVRSTMAIVQAGLDAGRDADAMIAGDVLAEWDGWSGRFVGKDDWIRTLATSLSGDETVRLKPVFEPLYYTAKRADAATAIAQYHQLKKTHRHDYDFGEANLNALGYYFLGKQRYDDAIEVFQLNVDLFPESANPYDSLGEAYMKRGDRDLAIECYSKALAINPAMPSAKAALEQLEK